MRRPLAHSIAAKPAHATHETDRITRWRSAPSSRRHARTSTTASTIAAARATNGTSSSGHAAAGSPKANTRGSVPVTIHAMPAAKARFSPAAMTAGSTVPSGTSPSRRRAGRSA